MNTRSISRIAAALVLLSTLIPQLSTCLAQGTAFTYQGRLNDGANPANGIYDLRFAIYDSASGPGIVAGPLTNSPVAVSNGLFTVTLDPGVGVFTGADRWLEIAVRTNGGGAFTPLTPRQNLAPTPYAIHAGGAQTAATVAAGGVTSTAVADGSVAAADLAPVLLNSTFWRLNGNTGSGNFLGSTDNQALDLRVNNQRALRLEPGATSPSIVGGYAGNSSSGVQGGFIGGGGAAGNLNILGHNYATIGGGYSNAAGGLGSFIGGGTTNEAVAPGAVIGGGSRNQVMAPHGVVGGGYYNMNWDTNGTIAGGSGNRLYGDFGGSAIGGGYNNVINGIQAGTIAGGIQNHIFGNSSAATVGGGYQNFIEMAGAEATIAGGYFNFATASHSAIGGGRFNTNSGRYSTIPGGSHNQTLGDYSLAAGRHAQANHAGTFVWADDTDANFASTGSRQFLIRAGGGVGINTNNPQATLHVRGNIAADALRAPGAGINTGTFAFTHRAAATNISGHITTLYHPLTDGDPNAILMVTHNYSADASTTPYETNAVGVWYNGARWTIYHENIAIPMPVGRAFNVLIIKP